MSQSEVERHKTYEHPVPVSPFEEKKGLGTDLSKNNHSINMNDLQKMSTDMMTGKNNNNLRSVGGRQMRKVSFRTFSF